MSNENSLAETGFTNFCRVPNGFLDEDMPELNRAELVVFLYICRRTVGFGKTYDAISFRQFLDGIITRDGRRLDKGTGLSRKSLLMALDTLVARQLIFRHVRFAPNGACLASVYELNFEGHSSYDPLDDEPLDFFTDDDELLPFDYLEEADQSELPENVRWVRDAHRGNNCAPVPLTRTLTPAPGIEITPAPVIEDIPTPGIDFTPTPGAEITPPPGAVFTPGEGVILTPPPGVENTPTKERIYQNKVKQNKESHITESPGAIVCDDFQEILLENGIWPKQAAQLARLAHANRREKAYLEDWLAWLASQPAINNPGAYLVKLIEANSDLPAPFPARARPTQPALDYQAEHRRRTNKLAESLRKYGILVSDP